MESSDRRALHLGAEGEARSDLCGAAATVAFGGEAVPRRLPPLAAQREELVERIPPAQPSQDLPVGAAANRVDLLAARSDLRPVGPDPSVALPLGAQELRPAQQAVAPRHQLGEGEQREDRESGGRAQIGAQHLPAVAFEQEQLVGEHRQVVVVADGRGGHAPDLAARDAQQPGELDVLEVEEPALVPAAEALEQRPADHERSTVQSGDGKGLLAGDLTWLVEPVIEAQPRLVQVLAGCVDSARIRPEQDQRAGGTGIGAKVEQRDQGIEPARAHDHVHVQDREVIAARLGQRQVDRPRVTAVVRRANQPDRLVLLRQPLGDGGTVVGGRVVHDQDLHLCAAPVLQQRAQAALERPGAVVVDDDYRDQLDEPSSASRLIRPLKIEMKSTAESICRPSTRKLVDRTRALVSVKGLFPAHWTVSWISLASAPVIRSRPSTPTTVRKRVEITRSNHRGGRLPASTPYRAAATPKMVSWKAARIPSAATMKLFLSSPRKNPSTGPFDSTIAPVTATVIRTSPGTMKLSVGL